MPDTKPKLTCPCGSAPGETSSIWTLKHVHGDQIFYEELLFVCTKCKSIWIGRHEDDDPLDNPTLTSNP